MYASFHACFPSELSKTVRITFRIYLLSSRRFIETLPSKTLSAVIIKLLYF